MPRDARSSTYTVVIWDEGDSHVRPAGPTSMERGLLAATCAKARDLHLGAEIVEWQRRGDSVKAVTALLAARRAEEDAIDAAMDVYEGSR